MTAVAQNQYQMHGKMEPGSWGFGLECDRVRAILYQGQCRLCLRVDLEHLPEILRFQELSMWRYLLAVLQIAGDAFATLGAFGDRVDHCMLRAPLRY